jgi:hypothetical protein
MNRRRRLAIVGSPYGPELLGQAGTGTADASNWTPTNNALLSNPSADILRVEKNGTTNPECRQTIISLGVTYLITGEMRSDGNTSPRVTDATQDLIVGTTSTSWQTIDIEFVSTGTSIRLRAITGVDTEYAEFRNLSLRQVL